MLRRQLPSANALFTFELVARHGSFSSAARELNVTQPAVSRAINGLESHLGYALFKRHGRWINLTPDGDKLYRATSTAFDTITDTLREIEQSQQGGEIVSILMSATAINYWIIPRMPEFKAKFPEVSMNFRLYAREREDRLHDADLSIRLSNPQDADVHRWPFSDEKIIALCAPDYLARHGSFDQPKPGLPHTLIEMIDQRYTMDEFFRATGLQTPQNPSFLKFSDYSSIIQAAIQGQGIALAWVSETSRQIIEGNLVPACTQVVKTGRRYHILASSLTPMRPVVEDIRDWLINEMRNDQKKLASVLKASWDLY